MLLKMFQPRPRTMLGVFRLGPVGPVRLASGATFGGTIQDLLGAVNTSTAERLVSDDRLRGKFVRAEEAIEAVADKLLIRRVDGKFSGKAPPSSSELTFEDVEVEIEKRMSDRRHTKASSALLGAVRSDGMEAGSPPDRTEPDVNAAYQVGPSYEHHKGFQAMYKRLRQKHGVDPENERDVSDAMKNVMAYVSKKRKGVP